MIQDRLVPLLGRSAIEAYTCRVVRSQAIGRKIEPHGTLTNTTTALMGETRSGQD